MLRALGINIRNQVIVKYENRIIGFIDILGFGQLVFDSENDEEKFSLIQGVLTELKEVDDVYGSPESLFAHSNYSSLSPEYQDDLNKLYESTRDKAEPSRVQITTFSDSIVFSCPASSDGLSNFRYFLIKLLVRTSKIKLLLRGGISCGSLIHSDGNIFGPAMNRAYHLESKVAKQPRIAVDERFLDFLENLPKDTLAQYIKNELIYDENDSLTYFNTLSLSTNKVAQNMCGANAHDVLKNEKATIDSLLLSSPDDPVVRSKIVWYANYFNQYLKDNPEVEVIVSKMNGIPFETIAIPVANLAVQHV